MRVCSILVFIALVATSAFAQKMWTGAGDGSSWSDPNNWSGSSIPVSTDQVIVDNSTVTTSYTVNLPGGAVNTTVKQLEILPSGGGKITVILPSTNTNNPGFTVGDGAKTQAYDLIIGNDGVFRNSSGSSAGNGIAFASSSNDSIQVQNGGRYVHNCGRASSGIISQLSRISGTETGAFEFDVPGTGTYSYLSASGQVYGSLMLTATAAGGAKTYSITGNNPLTIRGSLTINTGAVLNSSMGGELIISGDFIGNGTFTATTQAVVLTGSSTQNISGSRTASFHDLTINNTAGVTLDTNVIVSSTLTMTSGDITTNANTLTLGSTSEGTLTYTSGTIIGIIARYISGTNPMLFPVGTATEYHPLTITYTSVPTAPGTVTVNSTVPDLNGNDLSPALNDAGVFSVTRRSNQYWMVAHTVIDGGTYDVSVDGDGQNGIGSPPNLRIIYSTDGLSFDFVGTHSNGSAPATANRINIDGSVQGRFYLGGYLPDNPLPVTMSNIAARVEAGRVHLNFSTATEIDILGFNILRATVKDGPFEIVSSYMSNASLKAAGTATNGGSYTFMDRKVTGGRTYFYRIDAVSEFGATEQIGGILAVEISVPKELDLYQNYPNPFNPATIVRFDLKEPSDVTIQVFNLLGVMMKSMSFYRDEGSFETTVDMSNMPSGVYHYRMIVIGKSGGNFVSTKKMMLIR